MNEDTIQLIAAAVIALAQIYFIEPWKFPIFAMFWDWVARVCGQISYVLGLMSVQARANYFSTISEA